MEDHHITSYFISQSKISSARNTFYFVEWLPKRFHKPSSNITGYFNMAIGYPQQPDSMALLLKRPLIYVIKQGEIELVPS